MSQTPGFVVVVVIVQRGTTYLRQPDGPRNQLGGCPRLEGRYRGMGESGTQIFVFQELPNAFVLW